MCPRLLEARWYQRNPALRSTRQGKVKQFCAHLGAIAQALDTQMHTAVQLDLRWALVLYGCAWCAFAAKGCSLSLRPRLQDASGSQPVADHDRCRVTFLGNVRRDGAESAQC